jgi:DNA recombination protein RmuC
MNIVYYLIGVVCGLGAAYLLRVFKIKTAQQLAAELFTASEGQRQAENQALADRLKGEFGALSLEALKQSGESFLTLARQTLDAERQAGSADLDSKRAMIGESLSNLTTQFSERIDKMAVVVREMERTRGTDYGNISATLREASERTAQLTAQTASLREALSSTKARGVWGERACEDVLRLAGFVEGVSYIKQHTLVSGQRPDFSFLLPGDLRLNLDCKFPAQNYLRYLEAENEVDRVRLRKDFLRDTRLRVKEVTGREYIDQSQGTLDYCLLFIPVEAIYGFIHEHDSALLDDALKQRVILCSPFTLYAVLGVVRAAIDQFSLERTASELLTLFGQFAKQWPMFTEELERHGKHLNTLTASYESLSGPRRRQLEKPLAKIEEARIGKGLLAAEEVA